MSGKGGTLAPDLGKSFGKDYTPAAFTALMWNHAPKMWSAMKEKSIQAKPLSEQDAADLFAYFASTRMFDKPADAGRGKQLFASKHCQDCHDGSSSAGAKPVAQWTALNDPVALTTEMWNHGSNMRKALAERSLPWPKLTGQELSDILLYARSSTGAKAAKSDFRTAATPTEDLFKAKGCVQCHVGSLSIGPRVRSMTMNDVAAAMWNHQSEMGIAPKLSEEEMRQMVTSLWSRRFTEVAGHPEKGSKLYAANCAGCHASGGAPSLTTKRGTISPVSMVSALSSHGPRMLEQVRQKNQEWPQFSGAQMADLIAYLNTSK